MDLRKDMFEIFAKEGITIFEMKKADATLEDAFMHLITTTEEQNAEKEINEDTVKEETKKEKKNKKKEKKAKKNKEEKGGQA